MWQRVKRGVIMAYTVKIHTFNDGKVMFEDRIAYANGEYVSLDDFKISTQRKNDEISDLRKELRESKACITQLKNELQKKCSFETDRLVKLPFDPLETVNMLINATCKDEIPILERQVDRELYDIDDLEQIAEHLLVYCKHNQEDDE